MEKIRILSIAISFILIASCTSSSDFEKGAEQLEQQGYTNVQNIGYTLFCCSDSDDYSTGFTCLNSKGEKVEGCFCSGIGKGLTIRFK